MELKLGAIPSPPDPRTLKLASYLVQRELPEPPAEIDWTGTVREWGMMLNDKIGICAVATAGHLIQAWSNNVHGKETRPSDNDLIRAYSAISGYNPMNPATDRGCVVSAVLKYWRKRGIGGHPLAAFAAIRPTDTALVRAAMWLFGGIYCGLALPSSAGDQFHAGEPWEVTPTYPAGKARPGSWGGHAIPILYADADHLSCITWGTVQLMTWEFFHAYAFETWALISQDWFRDGLSPSGFDMAALESDLIRVAG
jgi:hypothetical protein